MLAEKNVPPKYLQQRLGHKDLQVTMKYYLHLTERMNKQGAAIINSLIQDETEETQQRDSTHSSRC